MEKLIQRLDDLKKAFKTLEDVINEDFSQIVRDATIQRFEYTFELLWKTLKDYLEKVEYIPCNSPKNCFREALKEGILSEEEAELCLEMLEDRNLSVHTYFEEIAQKIYENVRINYFKLIKSIIQRLDERINNELSGRTKKTS